LRVQKKTTRVSEWESAPSRLFLRGLATKPGPVSTCRWVRHLPKVQPERVYEPGVE